VNAFLEQLSRIGPTRLVIMFGVAAGVAATLLAVSLRLGGAEKSLLFAGLELPEVSRVTQELERAGVAYEVRAGGTAVYVAESDVLDARLMLSAEGMPASGSVGYEIFDEQDAFGTTRFVQNVNRVRALEGELARTISALDGVASARVHLALPERRLFDREENGAKASVWVELRDGDLGARGARAIRNLVAGAVPDLKPSRVTILDDAGRLLADGGVADEEEALSLAFEDRKASTEERLRRRVLDIVESVVGRGNAKVQVTAEMDFNRVSESAEIFDPDSQVVRSSTTVESSSAAVDSRGEDAVSVSQNVPGGQQDAGGELESRDENTRSEETINYEISKTTRTEVREVGDITRLSVAVAVNDVVTPNPDGAATRAPREQAELDRITALVRSAIGFDADRGDVVEVANVSFPLPEAPPAATAPPSRFDFGTPEIMRAAEMAILFVVAVMIIFLVVRPLVSGAAALPAPAAAAAIGGPSAGSPGSVTLSGSSGGNAQVADGGGSAGALPAPEEQGSIDISQIDGKVKASSIKKVSEIVDSHPDESISILRTWLHES
jgi:flagellar M-ring protein FliF